MGCLQSQDERQAEQEKKKPLLTGSRTSSKEDAGKATNTGTVVESTPIIKHTDIIITNEQKEEIQGDNDIPSSIKQDTEQKQASSENNVIPGQCLIKQTFDLQQDLDALKQKYPNRYKPLLERNMISIHKDENKVTEQNSIKVMQFNMLSDGLSTSYINAITEKTFLNVDKECLQWTYRGLRLVEEIHRFNPDIIAIEECDQLPFLMSYLRSYGYNAYFQEKTSSPIPHILHDIITERKLENNTITMPNDGVALVYKTDKCKVLDENKVQYIDMKQNKEKVMGLAVPLMVNAINQEVLFIVTHLKSTKSEKGEQVRERQINLLLKELITNDSNIPMILCCDLNANPIPNKKGYDPLCYNSIVNDDNLAMTSVYKLANGTEPQYTTFKIRGHGIDKHVLDYIFIKGGEWNVTEILQIPHIDEQDTNTHIPSWCYPSDHFSILAQLTWTDTHVPDVEVKEEVDSVALPLPGQCLIEATFDLDKDLEILKAKYGSKYKELLPRKMVNIDDNIDENVGITIMQFNMLADGLCTAYSNTETAKTFLNVDKECLQWTYRGIRIVEEIMRYSPDIIGIEECDQLPFLMKYLNSKGYESCFQVKDTSPMGNVAKSLSMERNEDVDMALDGVGIIYKKDVFSICGDVQYIGSDNEEKVFGLAVPLRIVAMDKEVLFVVTHLKSTKSAQGEELRVRQINLLLKELVKNENNVPIVLCCDLNANPVVNKKGYDPLCYNSIVDEGDLGFKSVYKLGNGVEPEYTTFKLRQHGIDKHVLDYIFIKGGEWSVTKILEIPDISSETDGDKLIPNWSYPSDHFSLLAQLSWK